LSYLKNSGFTLLIIGLPRVIVDIRSLKVDNRTLFPMLYLTHIGNIFH